MITADQGVRGVARTDAVGKVFAVIGQDTRQCLICDTVFTTQGAAAHAGAICHPSDSKLDGGNDHANR